MKKRITRDEQIDLMVNAPARMEAYMEKWLAEPVIHGSLIRDDQKKHVTFTQRKVRVACG